MTDSESKQKSKGKKESKLHIAQREAEEYLAGWKRAQADYQNLKKSSVKEKEDLALYIKAQVLNDFFPVLDNFSVAMQHIPESIATDNWTQGLRHIEQQLEQVLESLGVRKIPTVGELFNVALHEAVEHKESSQHTSGTIISQSRSGYQLGDTVIVPAKVVVAK